MASDPNCPDRKGCRTRCWALRLALLSALLPPPSAVVVAARAEVELSARCQAERCAVQSAIVVACPCESATGHGRYVRFIARALKREGVSHECRRAIIKCAIHSTCGKRGFVTCLISRGKPG